jgi:hypothetical protein
VLGVRMPESWRGGRTSYAPNYSGRASISVPGKIGATGETTLI